MIYQLALLFLSVTSVFAQTCTVPYDPPQNTTVVHPIYFPSDSAIYVGNDGTINVTAINPWVSGRTITAFYVGSGMASTAKCSIFTEFARDTGACETTVELSGKWDNNTSNGLRDCGTWDVTTSGSTVTLTNYVFIEWTDLMGGAAGNTQTHRTALKLTLTQQRDVVVESAAVPIQLESARIIITRVVYFPGDIGQGSRRFEIGYDVVAPCPIVPYFNQVNFALATTDATTFASSNSTITYSDALNLVAGNPTFNVTGQAGEFQMTVDPTSCSSTQRYSTHSAILYVNVSNSATDCFADGTYYFTFASGSATGSFTFELQAVIQDGFNLCASDTLSATVNAALSTVGAGPWTVGDKVTFAGNITTTGLPAAEITLRQATVSNTKPAYQTSGSPNYVHPVYTSYTGGLTSFGTTTGFKASFVSAGTLGGYFGGGNVDTTTWPAASSHLTERTDANTYPAGTPRNFAAQVTVFGGSDLNAAYLVPTDFGTTQNGFSLKLEWRVYFDLVTAANLGQLKKREDAPQYLTARQGQVTLSPSINRASDLSVTTQAGLNAPANKLSTTASAANVSTGLSAGAIAGIAVAGAALVAGIAAVAIVVARKKRQQPQKKSKSSKDANMFMTKV